MVDIPAGATKMPPIVTINLGALISTSVLINMGPLRSQATLERNASNQKSSLLARFFPGVNDLLTQTGTQPTQVMTTQAGQTARLAGSGPPAPPPPHQPQPPPPDQLNHSRNHRVDAAADSRRSLRPSPRRLFVPTPPPGTLGRLHRLTVMGTATGNGQWERNGNGAR